MPQRANQGESACPSKDELPQRARQSKAPRHQNALPVWRTKRRACAPCKSLNGRYSLVKAIKHCRGQWASPESCADLLSISARLSCRTRMNANFKLGGQCGGTVARFGDIIMVIREHSGSKTLQ